MTGWKQIIVWEFYDAKQNLQGTTKILMASASGQKGNNCMAKLTVPITVKWDDIEEDLAKGNIVKVVRCKDCTEHGKRTNYCAIWKCNTSPNGYCHRARK